MFCDSKVNFNFFTVKAEPPLGIFLKKLRVGINTNTDTNTDTESVQSVQTQAQTQTQTQSGMYMLHLEMKTRDTPDFYSTTINKFQKNMKYFLTRRKYWG